MFCIHLCTCIICSSFSAQGHLIPRIRLRGLRNAGPINPCGKPRRAGREDAKKESQTTSQLDITLQVPKKCQRKVVSLGITCLCIRIHRMYFETPRAKHPRKPSSVLYDSEVAPLSGLVGLRPMRLLDFMYKLRKAPGSNGPQLTAA